MRNINKTLTLIAILIILSPIALFAQTAKAKTIPTPPVPQFTVKFVDRSYDVPQTSWTTTDPNTGKQSTIYSGGNHIVNRTIDVTITNQPFTPTTLDNGTIIELYYSVRAKGHFEDWSNVWGGERMMKIAPQSSSGSTTTVTFVLGSMDPPYYDITEGKEDFQVKAIAGAYEKSIPATISDKILGNNIAFKNYTESDWSDIQTIEVPPNTPQPSSTSTIATNSTSTTSPIDSQLDNQQQPLTDLTFIAIVSAMGITIASLLLYVRKIKKQQQTSSPFTT